MVHTEEQKLALWESAEHYLANWQNPEEATTGSADCACCHEWAYGSLGADSDCEGCPIMQHSGKDDCEDTPWVYVYAAEEEYQKKLVTYTEARLEWVSYNGCFKQDKEQLRDVMEEARLAKYNTLLIFRGTLEAEYQFLVSLALEGGVVKETPVQWANRTAWDAWAVQRKEAQAEKERVEGAEETNEK